MENYINHLIKFNSLKERNVNLYIIIKLESQAKQKYLLT